MANKLKEIVKSLFDIAPHERIKVLLLSLVYFCVIAGYTVAKELKDTVFTSVVGEGYIPKARIIAMLVLVPSILLYSLFVDRLRRYQLLCVYASFYAVVALIFAFMLGHPVIGLPNTNASPDRWFGWLFYFFMEGYTPFVISVFWAFVNSISTQESAKKNYGLMIAGSKLGGMTSPIFAMLLLKFNRSPDKIINFAKSIFNHQLILGFFGVMCLFVPILIIYLMKKVPGQFLHGYEAVYKVEKQRKREGTSKSGLLAGFKMILKYPYVFGIFAFVLLYEVINTVLSFQRVLIAKKYATSIIDGEFSLSDMSLYLLGVVFLVHFFGFLISFFGTRALLEALGIRRALLVVPIATAGLLTYFLGIYTPFAFIAVSVILKALNYALIYPLRESLYIPTLKEVKFKAKSWIDAFGGKFGKTVGSTFNDLGQWLARTAGGSAFFGAHVAFFAVISGAWLLTAWLLGNRFEWAMTHNEVIGKSAKPEEGKEKNIAAKVDL